MNSQHLEEENIICDWENRIQLVSEPVFLTLDQQHGVRLCKEAVDSFLNWNQYLLNKFTELKELLVSKGYAQLFQMRIDPQYPQGMLTDFDAGHIQEMSIHAILAYQEMLENNVRFVSQTTDLAQLRIPEFLKDLYLMFGLDIQKNLMFVIEELEKSLQKKYGTDIQIYKYMKFLFMPKEIRQIDLKRKQIIKNVQKAVMLKNKRVVHSPISSRSSRNQSDSQTYSPARVVTLPPTNRSLHSPEKVDNVIQESSVQPAETIEVKSQQINIVQIPEKNGVNHEEEEKQRWLEQKKQLQDKVEELKKELENKDKSIKMLNNLIGNEEEELSYRENQVEMLEKEIKKLINYRKDEHPNLIQQLNEIKNELSLRDKSIRSLNALIANEEEQLSYRENQVQILTEQIHKLMKWKKMYEQQQENYEKCVEDLKQRQKSIKQLNKLIGNEEQELSYRESEVETLEQEIKKLQQFKKKCEVYEEKILKLQEENQALKTPHQYDEKIVNQIVKLQAEVQYRNGDIITLSQLLKEIGEYVPSDQVERVRKVLSKLKTVSRIQN